MSTNFVNVNVKIAGKTKTLKMEKGTSFENNGGIYAVRDDGVLLFSKDNAKTWQKASEIKMTAYQNTVFEAFANNDGQAGLSKKDILLASQMAKKGTLAADASENLPDGYKIDSAKYFGAGVGAQVHVKHDKNKSSQATLNFKVGVLSSGKPQAKPKPQENEEKSLWDKAKASFRDGWNYIAGGSDTKKAQPATKKASNTAVSGGVAIGMSSVASNAINSAKAQSIAENTTKPVASKPAQVAETTKTTESSKDRYQIYFEGRDYDYTLGRCVNKGFDSYKLADNLYPYACDHGFTPEQEAFFKSIANEFNGKPVTPKLVNEVLSKVLDAKAYDSDSLSEVIINNLEDLTPATIDKFLRKADYIHVASGKFNSSLDVDKMKKMYSKLNEQQKNLYYQKLLKVNSVIGYWATTGDEMNTNFADYIFEKSVSGSTYNKLKALITNVNKSGNGIANSKTLSKEAIDTLLQRGQITFAQANELYKAAGLCK